MRGARCVSGTSGVASGRISLTSLLHALTVAEHLNFRHAANVLGTTQSSVSTRIKALEETLGILLFERRHRGVRLTEAGRRFVAEISLGIEHLDHAVKTAGAISAAVVGRLDIGLHSSIAAGFFADLRRHYRISYPGIEQIITEGRSSDTIAAVRDGRLDVAFVMGPVVAQDCHTRAIWSEALMVALPVGHALAAAPPTWGDLSNENFLIQRGSAGPQIYAHILRRMAERGQAPRVQRRDVGRDTLMHLVAAGEGIALTSEATSHVGFSGVVFQTIADETDEARFYAVWSPHNDSAALKNLLATAGAMRRSEHAPSSGRVDATLAYPPPA